MTNDKSVSDEARNAAWHFRLHEGVSRERWMAGDFDHCNAITSFSAFEQQIIERCAGIILEVAGDNGTTERVIAAIRKATHV